MESPNNANAKKSSQQRLKHDINNSDSPDIKLQHPVNHEDFNFDQFQFKPKKKNQPQLRNENLPVPPIAILECPLCGCKSKSSVGKSRHLKECAKKRGMSFTKMMEAVELQKKQAEERRLAGLPILPSKPPRDSRRNAVIKRQLEPETALQADLQMALAMSLSLQQKREKEEDQERFFLEALTGESENEDKKLITALGTGSISEGKLQAPPGRKNRRKQQCITPFWLVRSREETKLIHAGRVVKILSEQDNDSDEENCPFIFNWKKIRPHCTIPWPSAGHCHFWEASSLSETVRSNSNNFYVKALEQWFLPKDTLTSNMQKQQLLNAEDGKKTEEIECLPSTLTALNALCANTSMTQKDTTVEAGLDGFLLDNTYGDGFFTQTQKDEKMDSKLRLEMFKRLLSMVDNSTLSDVEIIIKNDEVINCHKFILYINCPVAYQELRNTVDQKLIWRDISREGAITFLQFVYGGAFTGSNNKEMLQLAIRYKMKALLNLLSNGEDSDSSYDKHDRFDDTIIDIELGSPKSADSYFPSPILTSKIKPVNTSSPVLTSENSNSKSAACEFLENHTDEIMNGGLTRKVSETILPNRLSNQSIGFDRSIRNSRSSQRKLSYAGSSLMSPDLFSIVHDSTCDKLTRIGSKLEEMDMALGTPFATTCTPIRSITPETATSTPVENRLPLSTQKAKTFSISPLLAERPAFFQTSRRLEQKHFLGASQCSRTSRSKISSSCIVSDTPEINSQDADSLIQNGSVDKIYKEEESWEKFNYESEGDKPENGGSNSSLDSLVLESLNDSPSSEDEEVTGPHSTNGKRKLTSSPTSSPFPKRMKSKLELISNQHPMTSPKKRTKRVTKLSLDLQMSQFSSDDELASGEDVLEMNLNPEVDLPGENVSARPSPDPCFKLSSTSSTGSIENNFERNNTWNDFPEGYNSCDNLQLMVDQLSNVKDERDSLCSNSPRKPQLSSSSNSSNRRAHVASLEKSDISYKCNELLESIPHDSIWQEDVEDHRSIGEFGNYEYDLPSNCSSPKAHESVHLEEECVTDYAPLRGSQSPKPLKKIPAKKTKKLSKKLPEETCVTPMPHYSIMETPIIKKELKKIGVRPLAKNKGITILKHVYMETHPNAVHYPGKSHSPATKAALTSSGSNSEIGLCKEECGVMKSKLSTKSKKKAGKTKDSQILPCHSQTREKKTSTVKSSPEMVGNKQIKSPNKNEEMKAFIFVNTELRARIVGYQPIDFKRLHTDLKVAGLKPTVQELKDFLDDECITYTSSDELSPRKSKKRTCRRKKT